MFQQNVENAVHSLPACLALHIVEHQGDFGLREHPGALLDPVALNALIPDWRERGAPVATPIDPRHRLVTTKYNPARTWKKAAFTQMFDGKDITGRAVVTDRYRYIRWTGPHPDEELFDHASDPHEYTNLIRKPGHDKLRAQMADILAKGWKAARAT